tara:strand:- start:2907 stop:4565 length:1659 start_codon:yes stop_codon:yes gene_type:complete
MIKWLSLFIAFQSVILCQKYNLAELDIGKRGTDSYRVWIYFSDKNSSVPIELSEKTVFRRAKNGIQNENLWYDFTVSSKYIDQLSSLGIKVINKSRWLNAVSALCSKSDLIKIANLPFVDQIKPVVGYKRTISLEYSDIDPSSRDFDYGNALEQIEQINVRELHEQGYTGNGVRILVMDTGFSLTHNSLLGINVIEQWDVLKNDQETADETEEEVAVNQDYHGTAVLSTIASNAPGEFMGIAFNAEFLLAKTEDVAQEVQLEEDNYVAGLEWGEENGADIVSTSLGYLDWYEYSDMDGNTAVTTIGVDIAASLGVVCVTAAGNSGSSSWYYIIAPADADSVISVGAVDDNDIIATFSSHGPTSDGRIKPEVCARGRQTWCVNPNSNTNYSRLSGTSLACPLVAGAAALIIQARPDWSAMDVRDAIMMTASMSDNPDNTYGYGILNAGEAINYGTTTKNDNADYSPSDYNLIRAYPNPFNPSMNIEINVNPSTELKVDIFSYNGNHAANIFDGITINQLSQFRWEPKNISSAVYFVRLIINGRTKYKKVTFIK